MSLEWIINFTLACLIMAAQLTTEGTQQQIMRIAIIAICFGVALVLYLMFKTSVEAFTEASIQLGNTFNQVSACSEAFGMNDIEVDEYLHKHNMTREQFAHEFLACLQATDKE